MSAIQLSLSTNEWLLLSLVSRNKGMLPPEYLRDLLLKDLGRNYHLLMTKQAKSSDDTPRAGIAPS